jgi:hypothetical protein
MSAGDPITSALKALAGAVDEAGAPAMIIGGIAVIARGVPRHTIDIDATVRAEGLDIDVLIRALASHGIVARIPDARAFALERQVLLVQHRASEVPLDISLAWLPFEIDALERSTPVDFGGVQLRVAEVADLLVYKAIAWRDRDRSDVEQLIAKHCARLDLDRVRSLVAQFADALDAPERVGKFDAIVRSALAQDRG